MNRPRNRQPRPNGKPANDAGSGSSSQHQRNANTRAGGRSYAPATPQQAAGAVPTIQQVVPGASVFIVLKEDQPTGRETPGVVAELLTRGNHPRGIKVRLRDGQVGRVQRMADGAGGAGGPSAASGQSGTSAAPAAPTSAGRFTHRYTDVRRELDEFPEGPPERSLADFMPSLPGEDIQSHQQPASEGRESGAVVRCPVCEAFEGDEAAVTHHIEREHFG
ncbi:c2H2-type zinc-finger domain-containing protein [Purpureocillium lavendulum]|uniref:C2H2-type zinc-finger domain-containing protein n=1 Tax=Purpureocillium lavendulum TaxID=1247861 RepID=A0AB34G2D6_9HYPO|nr:c2H2-type zinc-finger domain-containing protein [Purpureocillium lavendulum]